MGVDVRRGGKVAVPQPLLNVFEGDAVGQQQAGTAVTQIVKAHPAQTVTLQKFRKCVGQVFHPHPLAQLIHEYKAILFIVVAVAADLLVQLLRLFHLHKVFPEAADERQGAQTGLGLGGLLLELLILAVDDR